MKVQVTLYTGHSHEAFQWVDQKAKEWGGYVYDGMAWTETPTGNLGVLHKLHLPQAPHAELQVLFETGIIYSFSVHILKGYR